MSKSRGQANPTYSGTSSESMVIPTIVVHQMGQPNNNGGNDIHQPIKRQNAKLLEASSTALLEELVKRGAKFVVESGSAANDQVFTISENLSQVCGATGKELRRSPVARMKFVVSILVVLLNLAVLGLAIYDVTVSFSATKLAAVVMNCTAISLVAITHCIPVYFLKRPKPKPGCEHKKTDDPSASDCCECECGDKIATNPYPFTTT